jgi:hypothetical protein
MAGGSAGGSAGSGFGAGGRSVSPCNGIDLTSDTSDCGQCGHDCLGATCSKGLCAGTVVGSYLGEGQFIVDGDALYVNTGQAIVKQPTNGGAATTLYTGNRSIYDLRAYQGTIYFVADDGGVDRDGNSTTGIFSVPESGGQKAPLFTGFSNPVAHLAVAGSTVSFASWCSAVYTMPLAGGTPTPLTSTACNVFGDRPYAVDPSGTYGYDVDSDSGALFRVELSTGKVETLSPSFYAGEMVVTGSRLYWTETSNCTGSYPFAVCNSGEIGVMNTDGTGAASFVDITPLVPSGGYQSFGSLVFDDERLYFEIIDTKEGTKVYSVPLAGGTPVLLVDATLGGTPGLAVDSKYVYYSRDAQIERVAK